jgi:hypothetical protein
MNKDTFLSAMVLVHNWLREIEPELKNALDEADAQIDKNRRSIDVLEADWMNARAHLIMGNTRRDWVAVAKTTERMIQIAEANIERAMDKHDELIDYLELINTLPTLV